MTPDVVHRLGASAVYAWHGAIPPTDLAALELELGRYRVDLAGHTRNDGALAGALGPILAKAAGIEVQGWSPIVTFGKSRVPLGWHFDREFSGSKWKLFAYLNAPAKGGGTLFRSRHQQVVVPPAPGTVVLFSIDLEHRGELQPETFEKRTIGVRPLKLTPPT